MQKELQIVLSPENAATIETNFALIAEKLEIPVKDIHHIKVIKKSIDARKKAIKINLKLKIYIQEDYQSEILNINYPNISDKQKVIVVGAGPAGLFAALKLIQKGFKPIILERGKEVSERKKDIAIINRNGEINPDSNYAFGEGGAGTFSDGKLYTRSKKRGNIKNILDTLIVHGAKENINVEAHPHIGSNKLPKIIQNIRETILNAGGEFFFNHRVDDLIIKHNEIIGVKVNEKEFIGTAVILASGHSAKDIYYLLDKKDIALEAKDFAIGVRIEHPQEMIDKIQYHCEIKSDYLPSASYNLVAQVKNRAVYSFCMCPGGFIVPAASAPKEIVVNGMSPSARNSKYANSGMVVQIKQEDLSNYKEYGVLAGLKYQEEIEKITYRNGGNGQVAPAQRMLDFVNNKLSTSIPPTSYHPGIISSPLHMWMPEDIVERLQEGFKLFNNKMRGYLTNEAVLIAIESRTSSPIRIPRDKESLEHIQIKNLYPCGEGAGYAGGIISAAIDGENIAEKIALKYS